MELCKEDQWLESALYPALLISSPMEPFLINYYADGVGMSASCVSPSKHRPRKSGVEIQLLKIFVLNYFALDLFSLCSLSFDMFILGLLDICAFHLYRNKCTCFNYTFYEWLNCGC